MVTIVVTKGRKRATIPIFKQINSDLRTIFQNMNVENYCVAYHCDEDVGDELAWLVHLKSCLCMKNDSEIFHQLGDNFEI